MAACYVPPRSCCYICHSTVNLFTCSRCSVVEYCSTDHQSQDSRRHARECSDVEDARGTFQSTREEFKDYYNIDENKMINRFGGTWFFAELHMWPTGVWEQGYTESMVSEEYIAASDRLVEVLCTIRSAAALRVAYEHIFLMHIMWDKENRMKTYMAAILLLQGEDQLCFQYIRFCKFYENRSDITTAVWSKDREALLTGFRDEPSVLEELSCPIDTKKDFDSEFDSDFDSDFGFISILVLFWWVQDLKNLLSFRQVEAHLTRRLNFDVVQIIKKEIPQTSFVAKESEILYQADIPDLIKKLQARMEYILMRMCQDGDDIWSELLGAIDRNDLVCPDPSEGIPWDDPERFGFLFCWYVWRDTPGAVDYLREMLPEVEKKVKETEPVYWEDWKTKPHCHPLFSSIAEAVAWPFCR